MKRGDYVTATLVDEEDGVRQGIYIHDFGDGSILVVGGLDNYRCLKKGATVISDENLLQPTRTWIQRQREHNGMKR